MSPLSCVTYVFTILVMPFDKQEVFIFNVVQLIFFFIASISVSSLRKLCIPQGHKDAQLGFLIEVY